MTNRDVAKDAARFGMKKIDEPALSKYINSKKGVVHGSLTEYSIYWLCLRYGIDIQILVKQAKKSFKERMDIMAELFPEVSKIKALDKEDFEVMLRAVKSLEDNAKENR
jgi:hypothetical protein